MKMVKKPRKSLVAFAIASAIGGAALVSAPAQAVNISPDGLGQVQIFPYYTVKSGWDTYLHLTNTSDETVAVKIRFREAKNSREVRDFNVILSPYDMWTAGVTVDGEGAKLVTFDKSCTSPLLSPSSTSPGATEVPFTSIAYDGSDSGYSYDNGGRGLGRTQEGYFEVIAMGASDESTSSSSNVIEYNAKHVAGTPRNCALVDAAFNGTFGIEMGGLPQFDGFHPAGNVLKGFSTLINVASGQAVGAEPTTLANFNNDDTILYPAGDLFPDLTFNDGTGANFVDDGGNLASFVAPLGEEVDNVSALIQRRNIINEFSATSGGRVKTDWVVTFPTKHNYTDTGGLSSSPRLSAAIPPFDEVFERLLSGGVPGRTDLNNTSGKSCVDVSIFRADREETLAAGSGSVFSPRPAGGKDELCNEVNVVTFNNSNVLGSGVSLNVPTTGIGESGWANMAVGVGSAEGRLIDDLGTTTMMGLPVIGFGMVIRNNDSEAGNNRNYASAEEHSYVRSVVAPQP